MFCGICLLLQMLPCPASAQEMSPEDWNRVKAAESQRLEAIRLVEGSVVAIYDFGRQGGGSGVVIDSSGIAVTNHHVIMGAGVKGMAGLADGQLYEWDLIGTDPGGEYATMSYIEKEITFAQDLFRKNRRWPVFNVTERALEETATEIIRVVASRMGLPDKMLF
jgi:hypothetical protein